MPLGFSMECLASTYLVGGFNCVRIVSSMFFKYTWDDGFGWLILFNDSWDDGYFVICFFFVYHEHASAASA